MYDHYQILKKPLITEKSTQMLAEGNWVAFQVHPQANKIQIKNALINLISSFPVDRLNAQENSVVAKIDCPKF